MSQTKIVYIQPTGNFKLPLKFYWQFPTNKNYTGSMWSLTFYGFIYDMPEIKPSKKVLALLQPAFFRISSKGIDALRAAVEAACLVE